MPSPPAPLVVRFRVPEAARQAVRAELTRPASSRAFNLTLTAFDTPAGALLQAGLAWTVRREGGAWWQALQPLDQDLPLHELRTGSPTPNAALHDEEPAASLLQPLADDDAPVLPQYVARLRGVARTLRTRRAVVELRLVEGRVAAGERVLPVRDLEFRLVSGPSEDGVALMLRWCQRHGLWMQPSRLEARAGRFVRGGAPAGIARAEPPRWPGKAGADEAFAAVAAECLRQVRHNAAALLAGDPADREEAVHQLRVGIRRLRSALRCFDGWVTPVPDDLVDGLKALFAALGATRDDDVLAGGVGRALAQAGAPPLALRARSGVPSPVQAVADVQVQALLLRWTGWLAAVQAAKEPPEPEPEPLAPRMQRRLRRWHRRIAAGVQQFDSLDEAALHDLRKRVKRQRYAVEFFAPVLRRGTMARYLKVLARAQETLGELNDLFVARDRYQALVNDDPSAWFALGWLAARIAQVKADARPALLALAHVEPPGA